MNDFFDKIGSRYYFSAENISDRNELSVPSVRRICLDCSAAMIILMIAKFLFQFPLAYLGNALVSVFGREYDALYTISFILNNLIYIPSLVVLYIFYRKYRSFMHLCKNHKLSAICYILLIPGIFSFGMIGSTITNLTDLVSQLIFGTNEIQSVVGSLRPISVFAAVINIISISVIAPVCEEIIFRKFLLSPLKLLGDTPAILISAIIFGLTHGNFDQFLYCFLGGIVFAALAVKTGSIIPSIIMHMLNNFITCITNYRTALLSGNEIADTIVNALAAIGSFITLVAYYGGIPIIILLIVFRFFTFESLTGENARAKLTATAFSIPLLILYGIMLAQFFI